MVKKESKKEQKVIWTGLGLIMGVAIGTLFAVITNKNIAIYGSMGAGLGLVVGAMIDYQIQKKRQ